MTSSPLRPGASLEDELDYYKKQYEQLETDLADFQASSKELEEQLERDIETAEKTERRLKEQLKALRFEVDEWKTKHSKAKAEANSAQNALQKEITTMRETTRALQMRLRDVEVVNDDYERQARNTESSLEDLESKYNVAIERGVLLDEEVKHGEQEREALRIDAQRLKDELSDLQVENEITREKLRHADDTIERLRTRKPSPLAVASLRARSPASEASGITLSSPTASTPPPKSDSASEAPTPPSPPLSDAPAHGKADPRTPLRAKRKPLVTDLRTTPRAGFNGQRTQPGQTRAPSTALKPAADARATHAANPARTRPRPSIGPPEGGLPRSESLYQIRNLRGRMQKIEERVHSARSKLPAPQIRTPRGSPRIVSTTALVDGDPIPSSVTLRRSIKRPSAVGGVSSPSEAAVDSASNAGTPLPSGARRDSHIKRLSFGLPRPSTPARSDYRPTSAFDRPASALDRPMSAAGLRPSSRATSRLAGIVRPSSRASGFGMGDAGDGASPIRPTFARPSSRASGFGLGDAGDAASPARPAIGAANAAGTPRRAHRPSSSISELRSVAVAARDEPFSPSGGRRPSAAAFATHLSPSQTLRARPSLGLASAVGGEGGHGGGGSVRGGMLPPPPPRPATSRPSTSAAARYGGRRSDVGETF